MYRLHGDGAQEREDYFSPLIFVVDAAYPGDGVLQGNLHERLTQQVRDRRRRRRASLRVAARADRVGWVILEVRASLSLDASVFGR